MRGNYQTKIVQFRAAMLPARSALIVCHDYPDPDCIGAAYGMRELLRFWKIPRVVIAFGGFVGRVENRAMVSALDIDMVPLTKIDSAKFQKIILVDCFPGNSNVSLPAAVPITAVFDHHYNRNAHRLACFHDIRRYLAAASTMIARYCIAAGCPLSPALATALYFGIKTDSREMAGDVSDEDMATYKKLIAIADYRLLLQIESPDRSIAFFHMVGVALRNTVILGRLAYAHLGAISSADYVAEMADFLFKLDRIDHLVCAGQYGNQLFYSIRTRHHGRAGRSAEHLGQILGGSGGGHPKTAAGRIPLAGRSPDELAAQFAAAVKRIFRTRKAKVDRIFQ